MTPRGAAEPTWLGARNERKQVTVPYCPSRPPPAQKVNRALEFDSGTPKSHRGNGIRIRSGLEFESFSGKFLDRFAVSPQRPAVGFPVRPGPVQDGPRGRPHG